MLKQFIQIAIEFTFTTNFQLFCAFIKFKAYKLNVLICVLLQKILKFFFKVTDITFGSNWWKTCIYGCGVSLAKVLTSKINDADQTLIDLNSSFRSKGLSKAMGKVEMLELFEIYVEKYQIKELLVMNSDVTPS